VTLRVLSQRRALATPSGRLLVGVSVLDDLPALALFSLSLSLGGRSIGGGAMGQGGWPFLLGGLAIAWLSLQLVGAWVRRRGQRPLGTLPILLILIGFAWLGETSGLTSLLGALWGGVILARLAPVEEDIRRSLALLSEVFLPLYFVGVGMRIQAATLLRPEAWTLAALLIVMALFSKLICGFGINARDRAAGVDRWVVVFGLIPRGLPGLVFASTALAARVIDPLQFSALVIMVTTTTMAGLLLLERRILRLGSGGDPGSGGPGSGGPGSGGPGSGGPGAGADQGC
jgi:Kef-type K+ transport system membrane component KefB